MTRFVLPEIPGTRPIIKAVYDESELPVGLAAPYDIDRETPAGWVDIDGGLLSIATFPDLFAVIGRSYCEPGDPESQFRLPPRHFNRVLSL